MTSQSNPVGPLVLDVAGMTCGACVAHVEGVLNELDGVQATVDLSTEQAFVTGLSRERIALAIDAIEQAGYVASERLDSDPGSTSADERDGS